MKPLLIVAAFAAAACAAAAQAPVTSTLTRDQFERAGRKVFDSLDTNHDGILDSGEQRAVLDALDSHGVPAAAMRRRFEEAADVHGNVVFDSFVRAYLRDFDARDLNHDGKLDPSERAAPAKRGSH